MQLPIDVVPSSRPPRFCWQQRVDHGGGAAVQDFEGNLPTSVEQAVVDVIELAKAEHLRAEAALDELEKLRAFKAWVHDYLDGKDVPKEFPNGTHTLCGCRIGDRMDHVFAELTKLRAEAAEDRDAAPAVPATAEAPAPPPKPPVTPKRSR